jgi:hypothetical protein
MHLYPLQACYRSPSSPRYPTIAKLLSANSSVGLANGVASDAVDAHAHGRSFRVDEMNSIGCGAVPGLTNSFALALWALDALFADVKVGVDGVNIHTYPGATYQLFTFRHQNGNWTAFVEPEYYGLLMFAQAAPPGSRLLRVSGAVGSVRVWATHAPDGKTRVLLINDDPTRSQSLSFRVPRTQPGGTLERLLAPGLTASHHVTLGGQSFGPQTSTGLLSGTGADTTVKPIAGAYSVTLPPASAALLTLR